MKKLTGLFLFVIALALGSCGVMRPATTDIKTPLANYKYFYVLETTGLTSSVGGVVGFSSGDAYGTGYGKSVNPQDMVSGYLMKKGFVRLPELKPELLKETMVVSYGESGRRAAGLGYAIEVTIQLTDAGTHALIATATAEGQGETEADDIRKAIIRAMDALFGVK